jgi:hypothetical protein
MGQRALLHFTLQLNTAFTPATNSGAEPAVWLRLAAFFEAGSELRQVSASEPFSPQPHPAGAYPLQGATRTQAVGRSAARHAIVDQRLHRL